MFSQNGQISIRQTYRLLFFDLIGISTLLLPPLLSKICGNGAMISIVIGTIMAYIYLLALCQTIEKMKTDLLTYLKKQKPVMCLLAINAICLAGMCAYVFTDLVVRELVPEEDFRLILLLIVLVAIYGVMGGIESRARVYELLFWFIIIPLLIMLFIAAKDIKPIYLVEATQYSIKSILVGSYLVFIAFSTLFYCLYFPSFVPWKKHSQIKKAGALALAGAATILFITYMILVGSFGPRALASMKYPTITLMSTIKIKGSFLKRTDALMLGIWFTTLFALLNINVFYGAKKLEKIRGLGKKKAFVFIVGILVYAIAILFEYGENVMEKYIKFLMLAGIPMLVLIPAIILIMGCNSAELEDRCFPMLAAVDWREERVTFSYVFPKLEMENKKDPESLYSDNEVASQSFFEARSACETNLVKEADANHLKVLLLGDSFYEQKDQMTKMLKQLQEDESYPRNAYVCLTDSTEQVIELQGKLSEDVGSYIEELLEKKQAQEGMYLVTIGDLIDENDNEMVVYDIPYVRVTDERTIVIENNLEKV